MSLSVFTPAPTFPVRKVRSTVRLRLTLVYSGLFVLSGAALLAIVYILVEHRITGPFSVTTGTGRQPNSAGVDDGTLSMPTQSGDGPGADLRHFFAQSATALLIMAVLSIALGWFLAGRLLRPLRNMTNTARQISAHNLHERLALEGQATELRDLGETINGLLQRLEVTFDAQRSFVANASHELRTPLTASRAMLQVSLADPDLTLDDLRKTCGDVLDVGGEQERMLDALLTLAKGQRGLDHRAPFDLAETVRQVVEGQQQNADEHRVTIHLHASPTPYAGDARLIERLATNLIDNAVRYNVGQGEVHVTVSHERDASVLTVANTGPVVDPANIERLVEPFHRHDRARTNRDGLGLGLSIVDAVAAAHGANLSISPQPGGGLDIRVTFPRDPPFDAR